MPINEKFLAARAQEQRNRQLTYLPFAEPIFLPMASGRVVAVPQVHITPRIELELDLIRSPFITGGKVTRDDVLRYLWRHHRFFIRPDGTLPNQAHRRASLLDRARGWCARLRIAYICGGLAWPAVLVCIRARLQVARQDDPAVDADAVHAPAAAPRCELDELCRHFAQHGYTREQVLDSPTAFLLQFFRSHLLSEPDGEMEVCDPSDALLAG